MEDQELLYRMALTLALRHHPKAQRILVDTLGSAAAVFACRRELGTRFEHLSERMATAVAAMEELLPRCEQEMEYAARHRIRVLTCDDEDYPTRLARCEDAPLVLYALGQGTWNAPHVVSIVGTRRCTERGREMCQRLTQGLAEAVPGTLVVSGLAYGIDIAAHRGALQGGLPTAGVLAHGLDEIYPRTHRSTAIGMLEQGGLLTEFMSGTPIDRLNFLQRNRIVAGMADAVVVVESPARGGSLNTARMAAEYHRDVFAVPGRPTDATAEGCNMLIRSNGAVLITGVDDLLTDMGWKGKDTEVPQQRLLFAELTAEEQEVVDAMAAADGDLSQDELAAALDRPAYKITPLMLALEIKGVVKMLPGGRAHLQSK